MISERPACEPHVMTDGDNGRRLIRHAHRWQKFTSRVLQRSNDMRKERTDHAKAKTDQAHP